VIAAIEKLGELRREEGQTAFPEIGLILAMTGVMAVARHDREKFKPCHRDGCLFEGFKQIRGDTLAKSEIVPCECRKRFFGDAA
jgi:hypothetical protein